ncbi:MAG TPA: RNA 2',3'-cyclic phosphodiesterase [Actinomycetota bacterium]|nr:RNA 2',3'-cyclic phosphodiesterase [Actinomycetota bacterium]
MADSDKIRLFVAATVPDDLLARLDEKTAGLREKLRNARWIAPENQHLTLKFLGWVPGDRAVEVEKVCHMVAASHRPATLSLTHLGAFPSERRVRVLWMGVDDPAGTLAALAADLDAAFEPLGFPSEGRSYTPHLTLARFKMPVPLKSGFPSVELPMDPAFQVSDIKLFRSHLSPKGARYEVVATFHLGSS